MPGFYLALGDAAEREGGEVVRFYLNVTSEGAVGLVGALTTRLNDLGVPFRLKVVDHPRSFTRCDAAVLYVLERDRAPVEEQVRAVADKIGPHLLPGVPALTLALQPGVGFADDPPGDESFGTSRCRLIAEALVRAAERGQTTVRERLARIEERFQEEGLDARQPYLRAPVPPRPVVSVRK